MKGNFFVTQFSQLFIMKKYEKKSIAFMFIFRIEIAHNTEREKVIIIISLLFSMHNEINEDKTSALDFEFTYVASASARRVSD